MSGGKAIPPEQTGEAGTAGFVATVAICMAMAALAIDTALPAFEHIRTDFGIAAGSSKVSLVLTAFFLGLAVGQLFYGPLSDRFGRRAPLLVGLGIYALGAAGSALSPGLGVLVGFRFLWGLGAAGPRSVAMAMVRDRYQGARMAQVMSFVMTVFILVPIVAPSLGSAMLAVGSWRTIFWFGVLCAAGLALWIARMDETLPPERRRSVGPAALREAAGEVLRSRTTVAYGLASTCLFGCMSAYLSGSELIIGGVYGHRDQFALVFGGLAVLIGAATLLNSRLVMAVGLRTMLRLAAVAYLVLLLVFAAVVTTTGGKPPFPLFLLLIGTVLFCQGLIMSNANAAAMAPVGHIAGTASALLGTVATGGGALLGSVVDRFADGSVAYLAYGFLALGATAAGCILTVAPDRAVAPPGAAVASSAWEPDIAVPPAPANLRRRST